PWLRRPGLDQVGTLLEWTRTGRPRLGYSISLKGREARRGESAVKTIGNSEPSGLDQASLGRAGLDQASLGRAGLDRAGLGRAGLDRAGLGGVGVRPQGGLLERGSAVLAR